MLVKNLKLFTKALLMNVKFFFLNILKTKCNSVRERTFFTLSCTLLCVVFKIFKKKKITFIKSAKVDLPDTMFGLPNSIADLPDTMVDIPNTMVDITDTMVDLPDAMLDLPDIMLDLLDTMVRHS